MNLIDEFVAAMKARDERKAKRLANLLNKARLRGRYVQRSEGPNRHERRKAAAAGVVSGDELIAKLAEML